MPASLPEVQLAEAVTLLRRYKHYRDCRCFQHRNLDREGFCSAEEALWSRACDRLLDDVLRAKAATRLAHVMHQSRSSIGD